MNYQLPPEIDQRIQSQLVFGIYHSPAEVLSDALDALDERNRDLASIRRGIEDVQAGRTVSLEEFDKQIRTQFGFAAPE